MATSPAKFKSSCVKTLSAVEAHPERSNQHEFNGVQELKRIFGLERFNREAIFSLLGTNLTCNAGVTWYDAREAHSTRTEYRLYFKSNAVMNQAQEGDNIILAFDNNNNLHCILIKSGSQEHIGTIPSWKELQL